MVERVATLARWRRVRERSAWLGSGTGGCGLGLKGAACWFDMDCSTLCLIQSGWCCGSVCRFHLCFVALPPPGGGGKMLQNERLAPFYLRQIRHCKRFMGKFVLTKDLWVNGSFLWVRALLLPLSSIAVGA